MSLRAIIGYASTAVASLAVFAGVAFGAIQNQAAAGPGNVGEQFLSSAPIVTAAPIIPQKPKAPAAHALPAAAIVQQPVVRQYFVKRGDTLSSVAKIMYGKAADWPVIYWPNTNVIKYPNTIYVGQKLVVPPLPRQIPAAPKQLQAPAPAPAVQAVAAVAVSSVPSTQQPVNHLTDGGGYSVSSGFQACVIRAESGGQTQIWNASGHWGLYQFSYGTWVAHGGAPADFGHAGGAEQTQIFWNTVAQDGTSDWSPYDGC